MKRWSTKIGHELEKNHSESEFQTMFFYVTHHFHPFSYYRLRSKLHKFFQGAESFLVSITHKEVYKMTPNEYFQPYDLKPKNKTINAYFKSSQNSVIHLKVLTCQVSFFTPSQEFPINLLNCSTFKSSYWPFKSRKKCGI